MAAVTTTNGGSKSTSGAVVSDEVLEELLAGLLAAAEGDFSKRLSTRRKGIAGDIGRAFNKVAERNGQFHKELMRVGRAVGREGKLDERVSIPDDASTGARATASHAINGLIDDLTRPTNEVARVISAVADGDLSQKMALTIEGQPVKGEFLRIGSVVNTMVDQLSSFADEVTRVAREVGTEGKLGGQAQVKGVSGIWKDLTDNVNLLAGNLTGQVRDIAQVTTAVANGDLSQKVTVDVRGEVLELKNTVNTMVDQLSSFADEVTRVAREVGTEGKLGGQAQVKGVSGTWKDLTDNVNLLAGNLTGQVRNIAQVTTAVARGDLSQKITVEAKGEVAALAETINDMTDTLQAFADEVTRVAREVGTEGRLGGQAEVEGVAGTWKSLTDSVNFMASNLTGQVRNIAQVTTAVARGDLSQKVTVDVQGEVLELKNTVNTMVDQLSSFADEVTRVAREVGTEGKLGGQAQVKGVSGTWKDLTDNVNLLAGNLTGQVRNIAQVTTAVARGDLSQKITVDVSGEVLELKNTVNTMVDQLGAFADEVTRVAREVGTEGKLGGQAQVKGVSGTWKDLTDNVNFMANNLTGQVRNIAQVTTAVARGDLNQKITVEARGEILELKNTINTMVDQLSSFADEVTRVAHEVGTEGKLGGQAEVAGVSGTWRRLTENVNQLAGNLTTQVRAIADVSTAVALGDLTRSITVDAPGEVGDLKDNINRMIANLKETTRVNEEQDWLKTNLARISSMLQGQRDLRTVSQQIISELAPLVQAQHGAFFLADSEAEAPVYQLLASYGYKARKSMNNRYREGESLVGQAALERKPILISEAPPDYIKVSSGLGEATPVNIVVLPIVFEDQVLGVVELASLRPFSLIYQAFLEQIVETVGVVLSTIIANTRTEGLLEESQRLAQELQSQSEELQSQQDELRRSNMELEEQAKSLKASEELLQQQHEELQHTNTELEEKAAQLAEQNKAIEVKNREIEDARHDLEQKAEQLALSSKYKSEFLANMSHELRTPLNSLLILARLLSDNPSGNLDEKQVEFAKSIHGAGADLLALINDILDVSKVEAGKMAIDPVEIDVAKLAFDFERDFRQLAEERQLEYSVTVDPGAPSVLITDDQRLQQIVKNLLSNAFKFTEMGSVSLVIGSAAPSTRFTTPSLATTDEILTVSVTDTGVGIDADKLMLIFEAFQQADGTTSRRFGGTGLGLSISREIARLLGGEIQVTSEPGVGSTFTLFLPVRWEARSDGDDGHAGAVGASTRSPGRPIRTLQEAAPVSQPRSAGLPPIADDDRSVADDRAAVEVGDRVLLVVGGDDAFATTSLALGRERGFKVILAGRGDVGLAHAREYRPDAIVLDTHLPGVDGLAVLDALKHQPDTRHIPVHIVATHGDRQPALSAGAIAFLEKPVSPEALAETIGEVTSFIERRVRHLLVVDDNDLERRSIVELIGGDDDLVIKAVGSSEEALEALATQRFDCMVLDLKLPKMTGFALLEKIKEEPGATEMPVIVYTGKDLTRREETRLKKYAESIIVKDVRSPERLLDETALFLHRVESRLPAEKRRMIEQLHTADAVFQGKQVLIVDDDVRNVFALTSALEGRGMEVRFAENGRDGIAVLKDHPDTDLVLMDIMMPEMDGYETMQAIRQIDAFARLPVIALTAKAMKGDRERSIAAGASDYITKPVDIDQLLSLMRVWLYK